MNTVFGCVHIARDLILSIYFGSRKFFGFQRVLPNRFLISRNITDYFCFKGLKSTSVFSNFR